MAVTRAEGQAGVLARSPALCGAKVLHRALIRVEPARDEHALLDAAARAPGYDWLVFTSTNAVRRFSDALQAAGVAAPRVANVRIAAVGPATRAALEASGYHVELLPGEALAEAVASAMAAAGHLKGARVLWPRAGGASDDLADALRNLGAHVDMVEAYHTVPDAAAGASLAREVVQARVDVLTFTSPSTVTAFAAAGIQTGRVTVATIGPVTTAAARARGLTVHVQATEHTAEGLVRELCRYFEHETGR